MTFTLLPAIDVADGRAVQLLGADAAFPVDDPAEAALAWQAAGAEWIHLVDMDAAYGRRSNAELLASVIDALDVNVELSGGIRDDESLEHALSTGCARVNISTAALADPAWCGRAIAAYGERVAFALDVRVVERPDGSAQHRLLARGGSADCGDLWETVTHLDRHGCARYVVTDVDRDGSLQGPNVELGESVARATSARVIASGGIASIDDLITLAHSGNLEGAIVGHALHAGRFTLPEALDAMQRLETEPD